MRKTNRTLMHSLTCMRMDIVYAQRADPSRQATRSTHEFVTAEDLKVKFDNALRKTRFLLLMPPIVPMHEARVEVVSKDPELQGLPLLNGKMVFIDTTFGLDDRKRNIWTREQNGTLQTADTATRRRMLQTYFPLEGRKVIAPPMFFGERLDDALDTGKYKYVLDRCLIQFEPYDRDYHRVTSRTYDHINQRSEFEVLRSTRHFGPMAFYLAWHRLIDNLVMDCIRRDMMRNAVEAVCLMYNLHNIAYDLFILKQFEKFPNRRDDEYRYNQMIARATGSTDTQFEIESATGKTSDDIKVDEYCLEFLDAYWKSPNCQKPNEVKQVLYTYREKLDEQRRLLESVHEAHGISVNV